MRNDKFTLFRTQRTELLHVQNGLRPVKVLEALGE